MDGVQSLTETRFLDLASGTSAAGSSDIGSRTDSHDLGDRIVDVQLSSFMRSCDVEFGATGLAANTQVYAFFDDEDVNANCFQLPSGVYGGPMITDAGGSIRGVFKIPEGRFFVGKKAFKLTGSPTNSTDPDLIYTSAQSYFFAGGLDVTQQHTTLNVITPTMTFDAAPVIPEPPKPFVPPERPVSVPLPGICWDGSWVAADGTCPKVPEPPKPEPTCAQYPQWLDYMVAGIGYDPGHGLPSPDASFNDAYTACMLSCGWAATLPTMSCIVRCMGGTEPLPPCEPSALGDPVAQSFKFKNDRFVTGIDVFFSKVDTSSSDIWFELRTMENGYPSSQPISRKDYKPTDIPFSDDSSVPFHVEFDFPVFVKGGDDYCFVVGGWSPNTRIWVAKLGDEIINQPGSFVETQPVLGSSFRSQNGTTWNAEQYEDIKYNLYVAKFTSNTMTAAFNQKEQRELIENNPFEADVDSNIIRVYHKSHGMHAGDKFKIEMLENDNYKVKITAGKLVIGHTIKTSNGQCVVKSIEDLGNSEFNIKVKNLTGDLTPNLNESLSFTCEGFFPLNENESRFAMIGIGEIEYVRGCSGNITLGPLKQINNIEMKYLLGDHIVYQAESIDSYSFEIKDPIQPRDPGRFGGSGVYVTDNTQFNVYNVAANYMLYGSNERWLYTGVRHNQYSGKTESGDFASYDYTKDYSRMFVPLADNFLPYPHKMACSLNETDRSTGSSVEVYATFVAPNEWVSPVLNLESFNFISVANRVENIDPSMFEVEPNGINRYSPETISFDGSEIYKYVTRSVFLKNPATDLKIAFDAFKDITADFDIYYKTVGPYQEESIDSIDWIQIPVDYKVDSVNEDDRIEYEFLLSEVFDTSWTNEPFIGFKFKIVGKTTNSSKPPTFKSLRIIAVL